MLSQDSYNEKSKLVLPIYGAMYQKQNFTWMNNESQQGKPSKVLHASMLKKELEYLHSVVLCE